MPVFTAAFCLSSILVLIPAAAPAAPIADEVCLSCHSDNSMASMQMKIPGFYGLVGGGRDTLSLQVNKAALNGSVHEGFGCQDCHSDVRTIPHADSLAPVDCGTCHGDVATDLTAGVHAKTGRAAPYTPLCINCHGAHQIRTAADPQSSTYPDNLPSTCGACHRQTGLMQSLGVLILDPVKSYLQSVHWEAINSQPALHAATCTDCHGVHKILPPQNPQSPIFKANVPRTCGKCHGQIEDRYDRGIHGQSLAKGNFDAPACADCHGEHAIRSPQQPASPTYSVNVSTTCAQCHGSALLARRFGLPSDVVSSYQSSYHGLADQYGNTAVANCASCHQAHLILPREDPASSINPANLKTTCGNCHPGATAAFASTPIHLDIATSSSPVLGWIRALYIILIATVVGGLALHNMFDFLRRYRAAVRELRSEAVYTRMRKIDLAQHWVLLVSFFVLVITGFALKYPHSFWSIPFRITPAAFDWRGVLHRIAAVALIAASLYHFGFIVATPRGRAFLRAMLPRWRDIRDFGTQLRWFVGFSRRPARFGLFSYIEKLEYLALLWGTTIMVGSGLMLWFKGTTTRILLGWALTAAILVHFYEAVLAFTTILIWHLYTVFTHGARPPFNTVWLTGKMTREELREEHPEAFEAQENSRQEALRQKATQEEPDPPPPGAGGGKDPDTGAPVNRPIENPIEGRHESLVSTEALFSCSRRSRSMFPRKYPSPSRNISRRRAVGVRS